MRADLQIPDEQCLDFGNQQLVREQKASHLSWIIPSFWVLLCLKRFRASKFNHLVEI